MTTTDDERLAQLQQRNTPTWITWTVHNQTGPASWCTKPAGTPFGVHVEHDPGHLQAWINRVNAITRAGITITFHPATTIGPVTATATWTSPGSRKPTTHGPADVADVLDYAEDIHARQTGLIQWLNDDPEGTARHLSDAQIEDLIPHVASDNARRVLEAIVRDHAGSRRETYLDRSLPPTGPLAILLNGTGSTEAASVPVPPE
ncbi:MAG TPA: hypothetical protein VMG38_14300 [Trebonia sp.]|nr:hypothetical protein [Trebonia sp.]